MTATNFTDPLLGFVQQRSPLCLSPQTPVLTTLTHLRAASTSCALLVEDQKLAGIFTERDAVRAIAAELDLATTPTSALMTQTVLTIRDTELEDLLTVLRRFQQHRVRHLPVLDGADRVLGVLTPQLLRSVLSPHDLLRVRRVREAMQSQVVHAAPTETIAALSRLMTQWRVSCVVITQPNSTKLYPLGIVTERDLVRLRAAGLDPNQTLSQDVMSAPLIPIQSHRSLWEANQQMQQNNIRRLVVVGEVGELVGILTQTSIIRALDPLEMSNVISTLQRQVDEQTAALQTEVNQRQQLVNSLTESEARYRGIVEAQTDLIVRSAPNTVITFVNSATCRVTGYCAAQVLGRSWREFVYEDDLPTVMEQLANLTPHQPSFNTEQRIRVADGQLRWFQWFNQGIFDRYGQLLEIQAIGHDVTARKQSEATLQDREAMLRSIGDNVPKGAIYQLVHEPPDRWYFSYFSAGIEALVGLTPEAIMQDASVLHKLILDEDRPLHDRLTQESLDNLTVFEMEMRKRTLWGEIQWSQVRSSPRRLSDGRTIWDGIEVDITDLKRTEEALRRSEHQLAEAQQIARMGSWEFNVLTGKFTWTAELFHLYGLNPNKPELTYPEVVKWCHPDDRTRLHDCVEQAIQTGTAYTIDHRIHRTNHTVVWLEVRGEPLFNAQGQVVRLVGTARDISDRKTAEEALHHAKEAAEAANKAKSSFLTNMSHELRTPLTAVLGFAELLHQDDTLTAEQHELTEIIIRSGEHLLALINDVLALSKIEAGRMSLNQTEFDLPGLLDNLKNLLHLKAQAKRLQLQIDIAPDVPCQVQGDFAKLRQVLLNLLDNAIKFTKVGGVTLRVRLGQNRQNRNDVLNHDVLNHDVLDGDPEDDRSPDDPLAESSRSCASSLLYFEVEDTGLGIAPHELDRLFESFTQTETGRQSQQGSGLGLTISQRFVQLMGGEISVSSVVGEGTVFWFYVPLTIRRSLVPAETSSSDASDELELEIAEPEGTEPEGTEPEGTELEGTKPEGTELENISQHRILIVDDRTTNLELLSRLLRKVGFQVQQATNGEEAVQQWETWQPNLILMDMQMPLIDGYEATQRIRSQEARLRSSSSNSAPATQPATKIIAVTASVFDEQKSRILAAGCDDVLAKPLEINRLYRTIAHHLNLPEKTLTTHLSQPPSHSSTPSEPSLSDSDWLAVPADWRTEFRQAAQCLNDDRCQELVQQIATQHPQVAQFITGLIENFRFDTILSLTNPQPPTS